MNEEIESEFIDLYKTKIKLKHSENMSGAKK